MPGSSLAGVITAVATVITAMGGLLLAVGVIIPILRTARETKKAVGEVHVLVNQQQTDLRNYQRALIQALKKAGVDVPPDQSQPDEHG